MFGNLKALRRVQELELEFGKVRNEFKQLSLEWENAYGKLTSIVQRISQKARKVEQLSEATDPGGEVPGPRPVMTRQEQLQAEILERRRKIIGGA